MRPARVAVAAWFALAAAGAACSSSYGGSQSGATADAGPDSATAAAADAGGSSDGGPVRAACDASVPAPELVATSDAGAPTRIAVDGSNVYWAAPDGVVERAATAAPGGTELLAHVPGLAIDSLALTKDNVLWTGGSEIKFVPKTIAAPQTIAFNASGPLATNDNLWAAPLGGSVWAAPFGVQPTEVAPAQGVTAIAANATDLVWAAFAPDGGAGSAVFAAKMTAATQQPSVVLADPATTPAALALDGPEVFVADRSASVVGRVPLVGGQLTVLAGGQVDLGDVAVNGQDVYFATASGVRRIDRGGQGCVAQITPKPVTHFAVDGAWVYVADGASVVRYPR